MNPTTWTLEQKTHSLTTAIEFIVEASKRGNLEEVQSLWKLIGAKFPAPDLTDEMDLKTLPISWAAAGGHVEVVKYLIPLSEFDHNNPALINACAKGYMECVRILLPHYLPQYLSVALIEAAYENHDNCVHELLAWNPPNIDDAYEVCLIWASANKNKQLLECFYTRCNPERALEISEWWDQEHSNMLVQYHSPEGQQQRLNDALTHNNLLDKKKAKI